MTNYEKIKNMSVDELAEFLSGLCCNIALKMFGDYVPNDTRFLEQHLNRNIGEKWELTRADMKEE